MEELIRAGSINNSSELVEEDSESKVKGDPTDGALLVLAKKTGFHPEEEEYEELGEIPFDSENKYMVTAVKIGDGIHAYIKGAFDVLLELAESEDQQKGYEEANDTFAKEGMRVIAIGKLEGYDGDGTMESLEESIKVVELLGLVGIVDPPREDVKRSVELTQQAGIQVKMITGDHPETASAIAAEIGIENAEKNLTGLELDKLFSEESDDLEDKIGETGVFARVSPENKLQIVKSLRSKGELVAMTGDGVNDGPALNGSDIGVAMGIRGTEVAKEAADIILLDDRFATIVDAVELGRIIFANIKKFVSFLFTCCFIEIVATILAIVFSLPVPIQPLHILWLNLVIDTSPAMAFAFEPKEGDIMKENPRRKGEGLLNRKYLLQILVNGVLIAVVCFFVFRTALQWGIALEHAQTITFVMMGMGQLSLVFNIRREHRIGFDKTLLKNPYMIIALLISLSLLLIAVYVPFFNNVMPTVPLDINTWGIVIGLSILLIIANELINRFILKTKTPEKE